MNKYYIYLHRRISDGKIFYVGKGSGIRLKVTSGRNERWNRVYRKHGFSYEVLFDNLDEEEAYQLEMEVISELKYHGYDLVNLTAGGEGGLKPSAETRRKQSEAKLGKYVGLLNPFADRKNYTFIHIESGKVEYLTRSELCVKYSIPNSQIKKLFGKNKRNSVYGWRLEKECQLNDPLQSEN